MAASRQDIRRWFKEGKQDGASHLIVVCDTFDWDDYPVYVKPGEDAKKIASEYNGKDMQKVMEVMDLSKDMDAQVNTSVRQFNY